MRRSHSRFCHFFFQAEDGIRDGHVTGVQTCALPIFPEAHRVATSEYLFPVFAERVLSPRRPDRRRVLDTLGLEPEAGAFEIMARNGGRSEEHTSELQSRGHLVCRLLLEKKKDKGPAAAE